MTHRTHPRVARRAVRWLLGLVLLFTAGAAAWAQQDPPGRVARLNEQQGSVSFSPAGDDSWYDVVPNRPMTSGDRLWTDRNARAELYIDSTAVRLDDQTLLVVSELGDDSARLTATRGRLQLRVREAPADQRLEIGTANLALVVGAPGDYRIEVDPTADTTRVSVAAGSVTLYGENGESMTLGAYQQLTVAGRQLAAVSGAAVRASDDAFDRWVAERDRVDDQSISARYVSRDMPGYQQLDRYGDWQSDPTYGNVWYPRGVDADWAPYRDGQWADVAPWGWTWIDAAPWGFAPSHYGRWARIGPRWAWVPGRANTRPVYAPALVGFVGGAQANVAVGGRPGVGWFPLAPGEAWRPGYRASQRYVDEVNRAIAYQRQLARADYLHRNTPGALSLVPIDIFGRGPVARRDFLRTPEGPTAELPIIGVPPRGERHGSGFGRSASALPPPDLRPRQQQQFMEARQLQQAQQQLQLQQRAAQASTQQLQLQQPRPVQPFQQMPQMQQRDALRQQQELQQRAAQAQAQQQFRLQQQQQQQQQQQHQQSLRAQQEMQQRAAQAQAQQLQLIQQQQALRAQQQMQAQQQAQQLQMQQQNALRQAQEHQQRALQQQQQQLQLQQQQQLQRQQQQQRFGGGDPRQRFMSRDSALQGDSP